MQKVQCRPGERAEHACIAYSVFQAEPLPPGEQPPPVSPQKQVEYTDKCTAVKHPVRPNDSGDQWECHKAAIRIYSPHPRGCALLEAPGTDKQLRQNSCHCMKQDSQRTGKQQAIRHIGAERLIKCIQQQGRRDKPQQEFAERLRDPLIKPAQPGADHTGGKQCKHQQHLMQGERRGGHAFP